MSKIFYQVAVLVDAGYLIHELYPILGSRYPTADEIFAFCQGCLNNSDEKLFRIYYYDCRPFEGRKINPISGTPVNFGTTPLAHSMKSLQDSLPRRKYIAFRAGELQFNGWNIPNAKVREIASARRAVVDTDVKPVIRQKRVDMKIGLDVAWLASKRIIDRMILVTGDTDFIPAMKFARREGIQVLIAVPSQSSLSQELEIHSDEVRAVAFPPPPAASAP